QAGGDLSRVGPAADLYSAGVVLYEMLTGRVPFEGALAVLVYHAIHTPPPPPSQFRPRLHPHLEAICLKAMAKNPEERYATRQERGGRAAGGLRGQNPPPRLPESHPVRPPRPARSTLGGTHGAGAPLHGSPETVVNPPGEASRPRRPARPTGGGSGTHPASWS